MYGTPDEVNELVTYIMNKVAVDGVVEARNLGFNPEVRAEMFEIQIPGAEAFSFTMDELLRAEVEGITLVIA